ARARAALPRALHGARGATSAAVDPARRPARMECVRARRTRRDLRLGGLEHRLPALVVAEAVVVARGSGAGPYCICRRLAVVRRRKTAPPRTEACNPDGALSVCAPDPAPVRRDAGALRLRDVPAAAAAGAPGSARERLGLPPCACATSTGCSS